MVLAGLLPVACGPNDNSKTDPNGVLKPTSDTVLKGIVEASAIDIPAGVVVTASEDLVLKCSGPVNIAGILIGLTVGGRGVDITIESESSIEITGRVMAGMGASAEDGALAEGLAEGANGYRGGSVMLKAASDIEIGPNARIAGGDAGDGGSAFALGGEDIEGWPIVARGGAGGKGGDVVIDTDGTLRFWPAGQPLIILGSGGDGGHADAYLQDGVPFDTDESQVVSGPGGNSGMLRLSAGTVEGLTYHELPDVVLAHSTQPEFDTQTPFTMWVLRGDSANLIGGGRGGDGGQAGGFQDDLEQMLADSDEFSYLLEARTSASAERSTMSSHCPPKLKVDAQDPPPKKGTTGGNGWNPGNGGDADITASDGKGSGKGGSATAIGGPGGNLWSIIPLNLKFIGIPVGITVAVGAGGFGGDANAAGGSGGFNGGSGGKATATGGNGGDAPYFQSLVDLNTPSTHGGPGGNAEANGGFGQHGVSCCNPPSPGQNGGTGGVAEATGGDGGDGFHYGFGGSATAHSGDGGRGGWGSTFGGGAIAAPASATIGTSGSGNFEPAGNGAITGILVDAVSAPTANATDGAGADDGKVCPTGACCDGEQCTITTYESCAGDYQGDATTCDPDPCLTGACCADEFCYVTTKRDCDEFGYVYQGDGSSCDPDPCVDEPSENAFYLNPDALEFVHYVGQTECPQELAVVSFTNTSAGVIYFEVSVGNGLYAELGSASLMPGETGMLFPYFDCSTTDASAVGNLTVIGTLEDDTSYEVVLEVDATIE